MEPGATPTMNPEKALRLLVAQSPAPAAAPLTSVTTPLAPLAPLAAESVEAAGWAAGSLNE